MSKSKSLIRQLPKGFEWKIEWKIDDAGTPDLSWLGDFTRTAQSEDFIVDRHRGVLLGPHEEKYLRFVWALSEEDFPDEFTWEGRNWLLLDDEEGEEGWYRFDDRPILKEDLTRSGWRDLEWWSTDRYDWADTEKYPLEEVIKWVVEDYERHCGFGDSWWFEGCIVRLMYDGEELNFDSVWGIESDRDKDYECEVEEDLMWEVLDLQMLQDRLLEVTALCRGYAWMRIHNSHVEYAEAEVKAFEELVALYPQIQAELQTAYEAQRAAWEAKKDAE